MKRCCQKVRWTLSIILILYFCSGWLWFFSIFHCSFLEINDEGFGLISIESNYDNINNNIFFSYNSNATKSCLLYNTNEKENYFNLPQTIGQYCAAIGISLHFISFMIVLLITIIADTKLYNRTHNDHHPRQNERQPRNSFMSQSFSPDGSGSLEFDDCLSTSSTSSADTSSDYTEGGIIHEFFLFLADLAEIYINKKKKKKKKTATVRLIKRLYKIQRFALLLSFFLLIGTFAFRIGICGSNKSKNINNNNEEEDDPYVHIFECELGVAGYIAIANIFLLLDLLLLTFCTHPILILRPVISHDNSDEEKKTTTTTTTAGTGTTTRGMNGHDSHGIVDIDVIETQPMHGNRYANHSLPPQTIIRATAAAPRRASKGIDPEFDNGNVRDIDHQQFRGEKKKAKENDSNESSANARESSRSDITAPSHFAPIKTGFSRLSSSMMRGLKNSQLTTPTPTAAQKSKNHDGDEPVRKPPIKRSGPPILPGSMRNSASIPGGTISSRSRPGMGGRLDSTFSLISVYDDDDEASEFYNDSGHGDYINNYISDGIDTIGDQPLSKSESEMKTRNSDKKTATPTSINTTTSTNTKVYNKYDDNQSSSKTKSGSRIVAESPRSRIRPGIDGKHGSTFSLTSVYDDSSSEFHNDSGGGGGGGGDFPENNIGFGHDLYEDTIDFIPLQRHFTGRISEGSVEVEDHTLSEEDTTSHV